MRSLFIAAAVAIHFVIPGLAGAQITTGAIQG